jgi:hypothetical protein
MSGYMIAVSEGIGSSMIFFPAGLPPLVYTNYEQARAALKGFVANRNLTPILYGETFPYEDTSFEAELENNGFAVYGVGDYIIDEEPCRVPFGVKRVSIV